METFCLDISFVLRWFCILMLFFWLSQYFFVLITRLPQGTSQYYLVLHGLHKALPSATLYYKTCTKFPVPLCSTKTCTKYFPLLLFTARLLQSRFQYYFVLQDLHKVLPGTILYSKAGTELLHTASFYTEKLLHTQRLLHREAFTQRSFYIEKLLRTEAFARKCFDAEKLVQTEAFIQRSFLRREACTILYTQMLWHREACTHRSFYKEKLLHREAFTKRSFYTEELLHRSFYAQMLLRREAFTHRCFYAEKLLHGEAFTQRSFYTEKLWHAASFYTEKLLRAASFYTEKLYVHNGNRNCSSAPKLKRRFRRNFWHQL